MGYKSYGQKKRESYDYRTNYIKHNPGLFGSLYFCSQCMKVMNVHEMEVDHIFPVSKFFAPNRVMNCTAICSRCNKIKSDKIRFGIDHNEDHSKRLHFMTPKSMLAKLIEESYVYGQRGIVLAFRLGWNLFLALMRMLVAPLKTDRSVLQKCVIVAFYFIVFNILKNHLFGRG